MLEVDDRELVIRFRGHSHIIRYNIGMLRLADAAMEMERMVYEVIPGGDDGSLKARAAVFSAMASTQRRVTVDVDAIAA